MNINERKSSDTRLDGLEGEILYGAEENAGQNEKRVRGGFWKTFAKAADKLPFLEDLVASYYCALDPTLPTASVRFYLLLSPISSCRLTPFPIS